MSWISVTQHDPKPMTWWLNEFKRGRMDTSPPYQRRSNLWGKWKRAHLIDSILNGFDVPKFYVADFNVGNSKLNFESKPYAVIDGKQRFEAIFDFMEDIFPLNTSSKLLDEDVRWIGGKSYSEIRDRHPAIAQRIDAFVPVVMSVRASEEALIEQLFVRLNSGVSVNGAERRNAMPGPVPQSLRTLTLHPFFEEQIRFNTNRMQEFNLAAKLLLFEWSDGFVDTKAKDLDLFVARAADGFDEIEQKLNSVTSRPKRKAIEADLTLFLEPYEQAEVRVLETLEHMAKIFTERDSLLGKQGAIPIYYWIIRNHPRLRKCFRDFLAEFEPSVLEAIRVARDDPQRADPVLVAYYTASRTTNDQASLRERYKIMLTRLKAWA